MKLRTAHEPYETFDAELTTEHPDTIQGFFALKRADSGDFLPLRDVFPLSSRKFDVLQITDTERLQLSKAGLQM